MSKNNGDISIEEKFNEWEISTIDNDNVYLAFESGYNLAQKEMQEKLDAAIEVIRFYAKPNGWLNRGILIEQGRKARDFLKARGE